MAEFIDIPASPEGTLWCAVIHRAVRDLYAPNSHQWARPIDKPLSHPTWRSAAELVLSGEHDDHTAWSLSGLDPTHIRNAIVEKMATGETIGRVGSRESMFGPIDFRAMRANVLVALKQVADHYGSDGVSELIADDAIPAFRRMIGQFRQHRQWVEL